MSQINDKSGTYGESDAHAGDRTLGPIPAAGIGRRITAVAGLLGTRTSAAEVAGVSVDSLQRYFREENMLAFDVAARMCLAAKVRMEWLATGHGEMHEAPETAPDQASQAVRREDLMMAMQLASEALGNKVLPPADHAELVSLLYELLVEGLPQATVLRFAKKAAGV